MVTMKKSKGLGRGLEALLGPRTQQPFQQDEEDAAVVDAPSVLALDEMVAGKYQPRTQMDEGALYELAESIKVQGVLQPVLVRRLSAGPNSGKYEIIAGERRFRAAGLAGLDRIPVLVREVSDEAAAAMALIENIQREELNPLEQAHGLHRLVTEFGHTHEQAAQAVGRSRSATSNLLRLLQLTKPVQTMLQAGDLDMGHARALLGLAQAEQVVAANQIATKKLSVRDAERLVKRMGSHGVTADSPTKAARQDAKSPDLLRLQEQLADLLAAPVDIRLKSTESSGNGRAKGRKPAAQLGELAIGFGSIDALNGLIERILQTN